jgi:ribose 1,5-bisphosphokinase
MTGRLILIVGPSGAGKDTLIAHAKTQLAHNPQITFPRRVITRPPDATEDHEQVTPQEFTRRESTQQFALSWHAHNLSYGIPKIIESTIAAGATAIINVSRAVIDDARKKYPTTVIEITAAPETLSARLQSRARESQTDIQHRLTRVIPTTADATIHNDTTIAVAVEKFIGLILGAG